MFDNEKSYILFIDDIIDFAKRWFNIEYSIE